MMELKDKNKLVDFLRSCVRGFKGDTSDYARGYRRAILHSRTAIEAVARGECWDDQSDDWVAGDEK
jgi:hypothetical protein